MENVFASRALQVLPVQRGLVRETIVQVTVPATRRQRHAHAMTDTRDQIALQSRVSLIVARMECAARASAFVNHPSQEDLVKQKCAQ